MPTPSRESVREFGSCATAETHRLSSAYLRRILTLHHLPVRLGRCDTGIEDTPERRPLSSGTPALNTRSNYRTVSRRAVGMPPCRLFPQSGLVLRTTWRPQAPLHFFSLAAGSSLRCRRDSNLFGAWISRRKPPRCESQSP